MRLATFVRDGETSVGAVISENRVVNLQRAYAAYLEAQGDPAAKGIARARIPNDMLEFLKGGERAWNAAREALDFVQQRNRRRGGAFGPGGERLEYALGEVRLRAPFVPTTIVCGGANFIDHLEETKRIKPDHVEFFLKSPHGIVGPGEPIRYQPRVTQKLDYEVELAIIIGKPGRYIPTERAYDHIFGYAILNDISARDRQVIGWEGPWFHLRFGEGKSFDTSAPFGPWIVTRDELGEAKNMALRTWVNDELRQSNTTARLIWGVPELVSYYSTFITLEPGIVICSGTPGGPALGRDEELGAKPYLREDIIRGGYLRPGDVVRCEIEGIGVLSNPVAEEGASL